MKPKQLVCVVIPIYRDPFLEKTEWTSLNRCKKILGKHPIKIAAPSGIELSTDTQSLISDIEYFDSLFFKDISGYNKLMTSLSFYRKFLDFEYILIYQLDAFVFRDDLNYWCKKGFDYIGAPWFKDFTSDPSIENLWIPGNGGFSLRKVRSAIKLLSSLKLHTSRRKVLSDILRSFSLLNVLKLFGYKNTVKYHIAHSKVNEDLIFAIYAKNVFADYKIPEVNETLKFSFDRGPELLYIINGFELPFGCHGWSRNDHLYSSWDFWKKYIDFDAVEK